MPGNNTKGIQASDTHTRPGESTPQRLAQQVGMIWVMAGAVHQPSGAGATVLYPSVTDSHDVAEGLRPATLLCCAELPCRLGLK